MHDLPRATVATDHDDGRLRPGSFAACGVSHLLIRSGGNAS